jgi:hypothetical protein
MAGRNPSDRIERWQLAGDEMARFEDEWYARSREALLVAERTVLEVVGAHASEAPSATRVLELVARHDPPIEQAAAALAIQRLLAIGRLAFTIDSGLQLAR